MTLTDKLIPYYVWFVFGFGVISILIGIVNFGMLAVTLITVKGIYIPMWAIVVVAMLLVGLCITIGYVFEKYSVWNRITSHQNRNANPEFILIVNDIQEIKAALSRLEKK